MCSQSPAEPDASKQHRGRPTFPEVPPAPVYYPTEAEFAEPFKYILSIKEEAQKFGICKIVPPPNWRPSWSIDSRNFMFDTRIQNVHQLQERGEFLFWKRLKKSLAKRGTPLKVVPRLDGKQLNLFALYRYNCSSLLLSDRVSSDVRLILVGPFRSTGTSCAPVATIKCTVMHSVTSGPR